MTIFMNIFAPFFYNGRDWRCVLHLFFSDSQKARTTNTELWNKSL